MHSIQIWMLIHLQFLFLQWQEILSLCFYSKFHVWNKLSRLKTETGNAFFEKWTTWADSGLFWADPYKESSSPLIISCNASEDDIRNRFADGASPSISPTCNIKASGMFGIHTSTEIIGNKAQSVKIKIKELFEKISVNWN